jgi:putative ATP-binding cassette transporter
MSLFKGILQILKPFWQRNSTSKILLALLACISFELIGVSLDVYLNYWNVDFYNSLQQYDVNLLRRQLFIFIIVVFSMLLNSFILYLISQIFVIKVRKGLTEFYTRSWLYSQAYINETDNYDSPDERISNDINQFVTILKSLFLGFIGSVLTFIFFSWILWQLSGDFDIKVFGVNFSIKGYLFWLALFLATVNILAVIKLGKPLRKLVYDKQKYEAEFRFGLAKVRTNKLSIADGNLEKVKLLSLRSSFAAIVNNFYSLTFREIKINLVTGLFSQIYGVIGIFLSLPRYFSKFISFGQVMQINAAFLKVVSPLLFFVYSYDQVAELKANVKRLLELKSQIDKSSTNKKINYKIDQNQSDFLKVEELQVTIKKRVLLDNLNFSLKDTQSLLIQGSIGSGKTTILRHIAGKNIFAKGAIKYKSNPKILFLTHKPYFPKDDFKRSVFSTSFSRIPSDDEFKEMLNVLGLSHIERFIGETYDWNNILSTGELQALNFCKFFIGRYNLVLLDEAVSNTSAKIRDKIYAILRDKNIVYISSSHSVDLEKYHNNIIKLD